MSGAAPGWQSQCWDLHGLAILGCWDDVGLGERWQATYASLPRLDAAPRVPDLVVNLQLAAEVPPAPSDAPDFQEGKLLAYYLDDAARAGREAGQIVAHFPRFGQLRHDLAAGHTDGLVHRTALDTYGVLEDLLAIGLSPHLRRRGLFLLHAFAAAPPGHDSAVLIVGDIGAGKTTTGLALLHAGWKLLSNDSPILAAGDPPRVWSYPGLLSAYADSLACFPELASVHAESLPAGSRAKALFAAEAIYPSVWRDSARAGAILLPRIEARREHALELLPRPEALRLLLPHAIEQWDRALIPAHLALLNQLVQSVPAYRLRLAPDMATLPALIAPALVA